MSIRYFFRLLLVTIVMLTVFGCASVPKQVYSGPRLPPDQVATITTPKEGSSVILVSENGLVLGLAANTYQPVISQIDGINVHATFPGPFIEIPPGEYTVQIGVQGFRFPRYHVVTVPAEAGRHYKVHFVNVSEVIGGNSSGNMPFSISVQEVETHKEFAAK